MSVNTEEVVDLSMARALSNGVPRERRFVDTGAVETAVAEAVDSEENTVEALAKLILGSQPAPGGSGGGDGSNEAKVVKEIKRHKWIAALMALLLGPGGAIAVVYATSDRSKANAASIEAHKAFGPRITETEAAVAEIKQDIGKIQTDVKTGKDQAAKILTGIDELKKENINRMTDELKETKRLLRKAERDLER